MKKQHAIGYINYRIINLFDTTSALIQKRYADIESFEQAVKSVSGKMKEKVSEFGIRGKGELIEIINIVPSAQVKITLSKKHKVKFDSPKSAKLLDWEDINKIINQELQLDKIVKSIEKKKVVRPSKKKRALPKEYNYNLDKRLKAVHEFAKENNLILLDEEEYTTARAKCEWKCLTCNKSFEDSFNKIKTRSNACLHCRKKEMRERMPLGLVNAHKLAKENKLNIVDDSNYTKDKFDGSYLTWKCEHGQRRALSIQSVKRIIKKGEERCPICDIKARGREREVVSYNGNTISFK